MSRIALITSNHRRHRWVAARLAEVAEVACVVTEAKPTQNSITLKSNADDIEDYFAARAYAEARWFCDAPERYLEITENFHEFAWQGANSKDAFEILRITQADHIFLFGSSIIRDPILSYFHGRIVNMHLGLSPYYRGSSTNFWPLADGLPECVGVTIHHATAIVDGGGILAQARPIVQVNDSIHDVGCKTIIAGAALLQWVALLPDPLPVGKSQSKSGKLCRRADFGIEPLRLAQSRMDGGLLRAYLAEKATRDAPYPIVESPTSHL
jgi:methionyl-tRNA formyltransferase